MTEVEPQPWYIEATFQPKRRDDLRPEAQPFIGQRFVMRRGCLQAADDKFPGQWTWLVRSIDVGWIPDEDLVDIKPLTHAEYSAEPLPS